MKKSYYAADNHYGSETSLGFGNTWYVIAFASKNARNTYVDSSVRCSTRAIKASDIRSYGAITFRHSASGEIEQIW